MGKRIRRTKKKDNVGQPQKKWLLGFIWGMIFGIAFGLFGSIAFIINVKIGIVFTIFSFVLGFLSGAIIAYIEWLPSNLSISLSREADKIIERGWHSEK